MSTLKNNFGGAVWDLPPLILHPFNERVSPATLIENSKAALMLAGLTARDGTEDEVLRRRVLTGRYAEVRMLFFIGKDVMRWLEQCAEWASRVPELQGACLRRQSFARLIASCPPEEVQEKLTRWGVTDYLAIFSRAIGFNALFGEPPPLELLSRDFLSNYHRYGDLLYQCFLDAETHCAITTANFRFQLYASGEYSRLLESQWEQQS
ncbi:MAG: hypothetical protein ABSH42_13610 [Bryobacteraceae bacterium]|jgi:hypothetical protein